MKQLFFKYKVHALSVMTLALMQVSFLAGNFKSAERKLANELAETHSTGGVTVLGVTDEISNDSTSSIIGDKPLTEEKGLSEDQIDSIKIAFEKFEEKADACLIKLDSIKEVEEAKETFNDSKTAANMLALGAKLKELGFLKSDIKAEKKSSLDDVSFGSKKKKASTGDVLDADNKEDLKDIVACHEYRIKQLDSDEEKKAYFKKNVEVKFADQLANSDSKEIANLAQEFLKVAKTADKTNALGFQTIASIHSEYANLMATNLAQIKALELRVAQNPNDTLAQSQLQTAKTMMEAQFSSIQAKYTGIIATQASNPQDLTDLQGQIQQISLTWKDQINRSMTGQPLVSFANSPVGAITGVTQPITLFGNNTSLDPLNSIATNNNNGLGTNNLMLLDPSKVRAYRPDNLNPSQLIGGTTKFNAPVFGSPVTRGPFN